MTFWRLTFSDRFDYSSPSGISIPIALSSAIDNQVVLRPPLDTGSTYCVFQPLYAELLGLRSEQGVERRIRTATGSFTAFGHEVTLTVGQLEWQAVVYFAVSEDFPINVVGRSGFLDRLQVGIVDYEQLLYMAPYGEP